MLGMMSMASGCPRNLAEKLAATSDLLTGTDFNAQGESQESANNGDSSELPENIMMNENKKNRKKIAGLQEHVDKHKKKIDKDPESRDKRGWEKEIKAAEERIERLKKRLPNGT